MLFQFFASFHCSFTIFFIFSMVRLVGPMHHLFFLCFLGSTSTSFWAIYFQILQGCVAGVLSLTKADVKRYSRGGFLNVEISIKQASYIVHNNNNNSDSDDTDNWKQQCWRCATCLTCSLCEFIWTKWCDSSISLTKLYYTPPSFGPLEHLASLFLRFPLNIESGKSYTRGRIR